MPRIYVLAGKDVGRSFDVQDGSVLGRGPSCAVRLHDRSVSREHARIERAGAGWSIVDLESRNGLRRDGQRLHRIPLEDFGEVTLGELPLRFRLDETTPPVAAPGPVRARPTPRPRTAELAGEGEVELEEEIELGPPGDGGVESTSPEPEVSPAEERALARARLLREGGGSSLLGGDLSQRPGWVQALVWLVVIALGAGACYGAFFLTAYLKQGG